MATTITKAAPSQTEIAKQPTLLLSLRSEYVKLRTLRSPLIIIGIVTTLASIASGLAIFFIQRSANSTADLPGDALIGAINGVPFANYLGVIAVVIVGALIGSGDFQHKTAAPTLINQPKRSQFLLAKVCFTVAVSIVVAVILLAACFGAAFISSPYVGEFVPLSTTGDATSAGLPIGPISLLLTAIGHLMLAGIFGLALGLASRSTTTAVSGFFVLRFIEVVLAGLSSHWVINLLPFRAGDRLLPYIEVAEHPARFESPLASAAIYLSVIAVLTAVGVFRTFKQDIV